jgi:multimeric flavodoxin WrbA
MTVIGINGSPRKNWNTATLLKEALAGAASQGSETEFIHLYDHDFKGCTSCFACKIIDGPSNGRCAWEDDLSPILKKIEESAEAIILATPIYFGSMSGEMRSFLERLLFAPLIYAKPPHSRTAYPRKIRTGCIYTMNVTEEQSAERRYDVLYQTTEASLQTIFGAAETFCCYDTCQFSDYAKVVMEFMDPAQKIKRRQEVFPEDCRRAFDFGRRLAAGDDT